MVPLGIQVSPCGHGRLEERKAKNGRRVSATGPPAGGADPGGGHAPRGRRRLRKLEEAGQGFSSGREKISPAHTWPGETYVALLTSRTFK